MYNIFFLWNSKDEITYQQKMKLAKKNLKLFYLQPTVRKLIINNILELINISFTLPN